MKSTVGFLLVVVMASSSLYASASDHYSGEHFVPPTELVPGTYWSRRNFFLGNTLQVRSWAPNQLIISGGIHYTIYTAHFRITVRTESSNSGSLWGRGSLVSGECSWPMELRLHVTDSKTFYVESKTPDTIYDDCTTQGGSTWFPTVEPFGLWE